MSGYTPSNQPSYLADPNTSSIEVIAYDRYKEMSAAEIQGCLRERHMVITGMPTEPVEFDEFGLQELTNLDTKIHIHGEYCTYAILRIHIVTSRPITSTGRWEYGWPTSCWNPGRHSADGSRP